MEVSEIRLSYLEFIAPTQIDHEKLCATRHVGPELLTVALRTEATANLSSEESDGQFQSPSVAFPVAVMFQRLFALPLVIEMLQLGARLEFLQLLPVNVASLTLAQATWKFSQILLPYLEIIPPAIYIMKY